MPDKCCVPGCKSNYDTNPGYVSRFKFPSDAELKKRWIECIQRKDWMPSKASVICMKHFLSSDIIAFDKYTDKSGVEHILPRKKPALKKNAFPTVFPGKFPDLPSELSVKVLQAYLHGDKTADKHESHSNSITKQKENEQLSSDVTDFLDLKSESESKLKGQCKQNSLTCSSVDGDKRRKMPRKCCVPGCQSNDLGQEYVPVFRFPPDVNLKEKWKQLIGREDYVVNKNSGVCAKHFQPDFLVTVESTERDGETLFCVPRAKLQLIDEAFPTIFPYPPSSSESQRQVESAEGKFEDTQESESADRSCVITSFQSLCREIDSLHWNSASDLSLTPQCADLTQEQELSEETDHREAAYITLKLDFWEQQRQYMHTFTDHYIDRMITEDNSGTRSTVEDRPDFSDMFQNLDKVEFLRRMFEELLGMVAADNKDGKSSELNDCTSLELADSASGDDSVPVTSATLDLGQPLKSGPTTGVSSWCWDHCSSVFTQNGVSNKHITETQDISSKKSLVCAVMCAEDDDSEADYHGPDESHKLEQIIVESPLVVTESCGTPTGCEISSQNDQENQEQTPSHTVNKFYNSDGFNSYFLNLGQQQTHKQSFTSTFNISRLTEASHETEDKNGDTSTDDKLHSENRSSNESLQDANCADEIRVENKRHIVCTQKKIKICTVEKQYTCAVCNVLFKSATSFQAHTGQHPGMKPFHCEVCGAGFSSETQTKIHMRKHTGEKPYVCEDCGAKFAIRRQLNVHRVLHTGVKPYKCDVCGAGFNQAFALQVHKRKHTGEKPYNQQRGDHLFICEICGLQLSGITSLQYHKRRHTGAKPHKCDVCGTAFCVQSSLLNHQRKHTGETPYKCDICGLQFSVITSLQNHRRNHTGEKPYLCDICGTKFAFRSSLRDHKRLHTGETPYRCGLCGEQFYCHKRLQRHRKVHSGGNL